ncbi:hypothetical protein U9M48_040971 [Paspalum notatum var. saurae]|uniref:Leucine-rich repeat-containing N-terminal plant-type domain-containing protein n=1 Tax=Paspalum notatum var. saurae TaxID=547442 RepID=A0AAQ3UMT0_PASNO
MASIGWALLLFLAQLQTLLSTSVVRRADAGHLTNLPVPFLCHPDQAKALLQLKRSFDFSGSTTRLLSWRNGTDCCLWEGVGCDTSSGQVTILDLNNRHLYSNNLDPVLFSFISLRHLDLSNNDIGGFIPAPGFERYSDYYHDVFSYPTYYDSFFNELWQSNFDILLANLSNLRELYLDCLDFSGTGEEWGKSLATSVLSLAGCGLTGPIDKSLMRLDSLSVINLQENFGITAGPFPEFFMDFLNLTVLQLSWTNLEGQFPYGSFKSKNLRVRDLSSNQNLSGNFPNFSSVSSLETLLLDRTNFSYARPMTSSNFLSLKELSFGGNFSVDFLYSFGRLGSLSRLDLDLDSITELGPIFSWIGHHENLMSLVFNSCNFSEIVPTLLTSRP